MDGLFCPGGTPVRYITLGKVASPGYAALPAGDTQTDIPGMDSYERYIDMGFISHSLEPLSLGAALGFGLITLLVLATYGVFKAFSLVRIKNQ